MWLGNCILFLASEMKVGVWSEPSGQVVAPPPFFLPFFGLYACMCAGTCVCVGAPESDIKCLP